MFIPFLSRHETKRPVTNQLTTPYRVGCLASLSGDFDNVVQPSGGSSSSECENHENDEERIEDFERAGYVMPSPAPSIQETLETGQGLVIGDSITRDMYSKDFSKLLVNHLLGARIGRIISNLKWKAFNKLSYDFVIILAGSKDCEDTLISTERFIDMFMLVLDEATKISNNVIVSSILPRTKNEQALFKSAQINARLSNLCLFRTHIKFLNNDHNFTNVDKSPRKECFSDIDGFTLSDIGYETLIKNLGIKELLLPRFCKIDRRDIFEPAPLPELPASNDRTRACEKLV